MKKSYFETRRPLGPPVGTPLELYRDAAQVTAVDDHLRPLLADPETVRAIARDAVPIPTPADREGYYEERHLAYWLSGRADLKAVQDGPVPAEAFRAVLDLGGASGRVSRHFGLAHPDPDVVVAELNVNHVEWVERYFPAWCRAVKLGPHPHVPLADGSVTLCVAFSVFTHMDAYESGWLAEVHRVLAAGGYAFLTAHTEHVWDDLPQTWVYHALKKTPGFDQLYAPGRPMPEERMTFEYNPDTIEYNCNIFFHSDYIRKRWGKWFDVLAIKPKAHSYQTGVVLRKRG